MDDESDEFTIDTRWSACTAPLRLWCHSHPTQAIQDAATISAWHECEEAFNADCVVVEADLDDLHMPFQVFRRLATPREATVISPGGQTISHIDAVEAMNLIAALLSFAGEAYVRRTAGGIGT